MQRTLRLRREDLSELTTPDLEAIRGGSTPYATDGHHCFGSSLCVATLLTCQWSFCECPTRHSPGA